jgi:hypothetical protein
MLGPIIDRRNALCTGFTLVKIYDAAMEELKKNEKQDETQVYHQN